MSKYLCTFPGKFGDILWSLPTAKYIAEKLVSEPVDFAVMPYYESIVPLIQEQTYIDRAFVIPDWLRTHSNYGDQPWQIPEIINVDKPYEKIWNLGYRCHPGRAFGNVEMPLMDFVAHQQGINFNGEKMIPFIDGYEKVDFAAGYLAIAHAFNEQYTDQKKIFLDSLLASFMGSKSVVFYDTTKVSWQQAACDIAAADVFVGDRSANWVIANGVGKQCITFEPHPSRHASGHLGTVFGCPQGKEIALPFNMPANVAGETAAAMVRKMLEERTMVSQ